MPKGNEKYPARLDFWVPTDMRLQVIGIGYQVGAKGKHAPIARKLLEMGIKAYVDGLKPKEKADLDFIMTRVRLVEDPKAIEEL